MTTALPNVNALIPTCAVNVPPYQRLTAAKAITATVLQNARRLMPTTATTKRRFQYRPTPTARPTTPTALPNVPPGVVTQGIQSQVTAALKMTPVTTVPQPFQAVRAMQAVLITPIAPPKSVPGPARAGIRRRETAVSA